MAQPSLGVVIVEVIIALFLALRYNKIESIWSEIENYRDEVEKEFARYLEDEIVEPVFKSFNEKYTENFSGGAALKEESLKEDFGEYIY